jgi:hypothetical protein
MKKPFLALLAGLGLCTPLAAAWIEGVTAKATSAQVPTTFGPANVINDHGFRESTPGSGEWKLTTSIYADGGSMWHSNYLQRGPDENPVIEFDLGRAYRLSGFRVWNHNANPSRGFAEVVITISTDGQRWKTLPQRFQFAKAPQSDDYLGEEHLLGHPVVCRYLRMHCDRSHRTGGQPDVAGLGKVRFHGVASTSADAAAPLRAGGSAWDAGWGEQGWIDVTRPPYHAKPDGQADCSEALQQAIDDWQGTSRVIYLPAGNYLVSKPLRFRPGKGYGYSNLRGAGRDATVVRLLDGTLPAADKPAAVLSLGFNGHEDGTGVHADWFNNNVSDLTIDVGKQNPGAIGLQFYSNNVGSLRRVAIRSADGQGAIGLDLAPADQNGPLLVQHVAVDGFRIGIRTGATVNSQTLEHISLNKQTEVAFENRGQCLAIRKLLVRGTAPVGLVNHFGVVALIDAEFEGMAPMAAVAAITNHETLFARNIRTRGYQTAIDNRYKNGTPSVTEPECAEFVSSSVLAPFGGASRSLQLPIRETPMPPVNPAAPTANVRHFRRIEDPDDTAGVQRAIDSGAATVYFPAGGTFYLGAPVELRGKVQHVVGNFAHVIRTDRSRPSFVTGSGREVITLEQFKGDVEVEHAASHPLVVRDAQGVGGQVTGLGELFLENVVAEWTFGKGKAWCRQYNTEREGTHATNRGGDLWILGLKTERGGTLLDTKPGGRTEVIGGLCYTTTQGKLAPMFVAEDADLTVTLGEVCYTGDPYTVLIEQTISGKKQIVRRGEALLRPAFLQGSAIPLYSGRLPR